MPVQFSGEPSTRWLTQTGPDRNMILLEDFWFEDRKENRWEASRGAAVDGASIPRALWSLVGSPYTGDYRRASIVHDVACVEAEGDAAARKAADKMFFEACREGGCSIRESIILYIGVRIGAWWGSTLTAQEDVIRVHENSVDKAVREDFQELAEEVLEHGESDDPDVVEQWVDEEMGRLRARKAMLVEKALI